QRRHQKIIEEGPVTVAPRALCEQMERGAVRLTRAVGYQSCGTVEYLYKDNAYYFLELNPRLQVEHPVTEQITGVNLPAAQVAVAMGVPLHRIPEVRRLYAQDAYGASEIDLDGAPQAPPAAHVIAVRVT